MRIENEKTGIVYTVETRQHGGVYIGLVVEYTPSEQLLRVVHGTEYHSTRSKARTAAQQACRSIAENHAFLN